MKKSLLFVIICLLLTSCNSEAEYDKKQQKAFEKALLTLTASGGVCDGVSSAWRTAIFDRRTPSGRKCNDFDEAIVEVMAYYKENGMLDSISIYKSAMDAATSELADPPTSRKDCYNDFLSVVSDISELSRCATNPSGSFRSYNEKINELVERILKEIDQFSIKYGKYIRLKDAESE